MPLHRHADNSFPVIGSSDSILLSDPLTDKKTARLNLCFNVSTPEQIEKMEYNFQDISVSIEQAKSLKAQLNSLKILE